MSDDRRSTLLCVKKNGLNSPKTETKTPLFTHIYRGKRKGVKRMKRDLIAEMGYDEAVIFDNPDYDAAILGIDTEGRVVYDYDLMVKSLIDEDGMTQEGAVDFIDYNTVRSLPYAGEKGPIILYGITQ